MIAPQGGTGKTALAIDLAVAAEALGLWRALVDLDLREYHGSRCASEERWGALGRIRALQRRVRGEERTLPTIN